MEAGLRIRFATPDDVPAICTLHDRWYIGNQRLRRSSGFLLSRADPLQLLSRAEFPKCTLLVAEYEATVCGYLLATGDHEYLTRVRYEAEFVRWAHLLATPDHLHVVALAVDANFLGRSIGKELYKELERTSQASILSAFVAKHPFVNMASIHFHQSLGFRTVASFAAGEFCGLRHYRSDLWVKVQDSTKGNLSFQTS